MASYGFSFYGLDTYGVTSTVEFDVAPFVAEPTGYDAVDLTWTSPTGSWDTLRVVRNWNGFPVNHTDGETVFERSGAAAGAIDTKVRPGAWHYYGVFVRSAGSWRRAGIASTLMFADHGYADRLFELLPRYHRLSAGALDGEIAQENETLRSFLDVLAVGLNYIKTYYDSLRLLNDPLRNHLSQLIHLGDQLGVEYLPVTPAALQRSRVLNASTLARSKGTLEQIRSVIGMTVGWDVELAPGENLMLNEDAASFVHPVWDGWDALRNYPVGERVSYQGFIYQCAVAAYGEAQKPSATTASNTWWTYVNNLADTTLVTSDGTVAGWGTRSYTAGVTPAAGAVAVGIGVQSPADPTVQGKNTFYFKNTAGATADLGATALLPVDAEKVVKRGVPIPRARKVWDFATTYERGDLILFRNIVYRAIQQTQGVLPVIAEQVTRSNISLNPLAATGVYGWNANSPNIPVTKGVAITNHPAGITTASRSDPNASAGTVLASLYGVDGRSTTVERGTPRNLGLWVYASRSADVRVYFIETAASSKTVTVPANVWTWVTTAAPGVGHAIVAATTPTATVAGTDYLLATGSIALTDKTPTEADYFDGTGTRSGWLGSAGNSFSRLNGRVNWFVNPSLSVNTNGWVATAQSAGTQTVSRETVGGPVVGGRALNFFRQTWATVSTGAIASTGILFGTPAADQILLTPGVPNTVTAYSRSSVAARTVQMLVTSHKGDGSNQVVEATTANTAVGGGWTRLSLTFTPAAGQTRGYVRVYNSGGPTHVVGDTLDVTGVLVERAAAADTWFDGDSFSPGNLLYRWLGTANATGPASEEYTAEAANAAAWQRLGVDERPTLTSSLFVKSGSPAAMRTRLAYPVLDFYDDKGGLIESIDTTTAATPLAYDAFASRPGRLDGRAVDAGAVAWSTLAGGFTVRPEGVVAQTDPSTDSLSLIPGQADGRLAVTFDAVPYDNNEQALVFRFSGGSLTSSTYFKANKVNVSKVVNGTVTAVYPFSVPFQIGDRMMVSLAGSTIKVFRNGSQVLTTTDGTNSTATKHGILVS